MGGFYDLRRWRLFMLLLQLLSVRRGYLKIACGVRVGFSVRLDNWLLETRSLRFSLLSESSSSLV